MAVMALIVVQVAVMSSMGIHYYGNCTICPQHEFGMSKPSSLAAAGVNIGIITMRSGQNQNMFKPIS